MKIQHTFDKRISVLEALVKREKGQTDPRWIILIILVFLLLLYFKTIGIIKWPG